MKQQQFSHVLDTLRYILKENEAPADIINHVNVLETSEKLELSQMQGILNFLEAQEPAVRLDWGMISFAPPAIRLVYQQWLSDLELKGKRAQGYNEALNKALELEEIASNLDHKIRDLYELDRSLVWNWEKVEQELLPLLDSPHPIVRAAAAKIIGLLISERDKLNSAPSFMVFLNYLVQKECSYGAVLGPFIRGLDGCLGLYCFAHIPEAKEANLDVCQWIFDILEKSKPEPEHPNAPSLEFYIHEYFEDKPEAVKRLISMDRELLAVESAANSPRYVEGMKPALEKLAKSIRPPVAEQAKAHLKKYYT